MAKMGLNSGFAIGVLILVNEALPQAIADYNF